MRIKQQKPRDWHACQRSLGPNLTTRPRQQITPRQRWGTRMAVRVLQVGWSWQFLVSSTRTRLALFRPRISSAAIDSSALLTLHCFRSQMRSSLSRWRMPRMMAQVSLQSIHSSHRLFTKYFPQTHTQLYHPFSSLFCLQLTAPPNKISTSGPRLSRRQEWRISKGMPARSNRPSTLNKQGTPQARRKAGRSHRRR